MNRFGYCCINVHLQENYGIHTNRTMRKKTFQEKGTSYVSSISLQNVKDLFQIIDWNNKNGIEVFRVSSEIFPWASEYKWEDLPDHKEIIQIMNEAGNLAKSGGQRLSFHPGPFNCLSSENETVVKNCIKDLQIHADMMDMLEQTRDHNSKINIHLGGAYGNPEKAADVWCKNYEKLPDSIKSRLTVENDDRPNLFSAKMLYDLVFKKVGVPIVFDSHHFECGPQDSSYSEAFEMAYSTWPKGIRPMCHHSNSRKEYENPDSAASAHSDFYYKPFNSCGKPVDVALECKKKEVGLADYISKFSQ